VCRGEKAECNFIDTHRKAGVKQRAVKEKQTVVSPTLAEPRVSRRNVFFALSYSFQHETQI
jgi:hypothetical protein